MCTAAPRARIYIYDAGSDNEASADKGTSQNGHGDDLWRRSPGVMDTLLVIGQESRLRILEQAAARVPGCAYLCVWAPIAGGHAPSPAAAAARAGGHLTCVDAWLCDAGRGDDRVRALFDAYRGSLCGVASGCVPGWAYKEARAYMELPKHGLATSASLPAQLQFYQEAGIKMAAFMGCESGEIEVGVSKAANGAQMMGLQASIEQVFSEDFFQQSLLEELLQLPPTCPSSSSSTLPSVSVGSPADGSTSLLRTMAMSSSATPSPREMPTVSPLFHPRPPHPVPFGHAHFPSPEADDAAMAQAMLAVISASAPPQDNHRRAQPSPRRGKATAFRVYNKALAPRAPRRPAGAHGQRMIKMGMSILRRMHMIKYTQASAAATQPGQDEDDAAAASAPSSSQLHHMISERRRRERLNESFETLRGLLPPGSKKDKATVLANTLDYMKILIAQVSDLEAKNRSLEAAAQIRRPHPGIINGSSRDKSLEHALQFQGLSGTPGRVRVEVSTNAGASTSSSTAESQEATIRVAAEGDLSELVVRLLSLLKEMGPFAVVAVDARQPAGTASDGIAHASVTFRAKAGELDKVSSSEAVRKAVEDLVTPPSEDES